MILWTIQPEKVYDLILSKGVYRCEESLMVNTEKPFKVSYKWLIKQMKRRLGNPPAGVKYPVWAWYQWEGRRKKPDLRQERWSCGWEGEKFVCMEIDIPDENVLLSDFDSWSLILSDALIPITKEENSEYLDYEKYYESLSPKEKKVFKEKNWELVFDLTPIHNDWTIRGDSIQATFWELQKEQIRKVWHFTSAYKKPIYLN